METWLHGPLETCFRQMCYQSPCQI